MAVAGQVVVNVDGLDNLIDNSNKELAKVVRFFAFRVERGGKQRVRVDTGATKNSIEPTFMDGGLTALIGPTTEYAPHIEFGTRFMAASPFMIPALEAERRPFIAAVGQTIQRLSNG